MASGALDDRRARISAPAARPQVLRELTDLGTAQIKSEVHACQIELITEVCGTVGDALASLRRLRRAGLARRVGLNADSREPCESGPGEAFPSATP